MKKTIAIMLVLAALLTVSACGGELAPNTVFSADDLDRAVIGVVENTTSAVLTADYETVRLYAAPETLLLDLRNAGVDCAVMEKNTAKAAMKQVRGLKILTEFVKLEFRFAVAKENPDLRDDINAALDELDKNSVLKKMIDGYFGNGDYRYESPAGIDRSKGALTLAVDGKLWPYSYDDGSGTIVGFDIDLARAVCDHLGVELKVSVVERENLIQLVQYGKADFSLGCIYDCSKSRELVDFTDPYIESTQVIVVRK